MTKAEETKDRLAGHKCYFRSRHLYEPKEITVLSTSELGQEVLRIIDSMCMQSKYTNEHTSEHYGVIKYTQYECGNMDLEGMVQDGKKYTSIS